MTTQPAQSSGTIEQHLRSREWFRTSGIAARLVVGLPALLVGPIILSCIYWAIGLLWDKYVPWTWIFVGSLIVLIPLLFWTEWRSGGSYYSEAVRSTYEAPPSWQMPPTGLTDVDLAFMLAVHPRAASIGLTELFLWGPRQVLEAVRDLRGMRLVSVANRTRAAEMLIRLQGCDRAEVASLTAANDIGSGAVVAYLVWFEWIGISADAQRVWMESDSREVLKSEM